MEEKTDFLEEVGKLNVYAQQYIKDQLELYKIEAAERSAKTIAQIITILVLVSIASIIFLLLTVVVGLYLGDYLDSYPQAFLMISGGYFLIGLLFYLLRKPILTNPLMLMLVKQVLSK